MKKKIVLGTNTFQTFSCLAVDFTFMSRRIPLYKYIDDIVIVLPMALSLYVKLRKYIHENVFVRINMLTLFSSGRSSHSDTEA